MKNKNIKKVNIVFESLPQFLGLNENLEEAKKIFSKLGFDENSPEWKEFYDIFSSDIDLMGKFVKWLEDGDEEDLRFIIDTIKRAKEVEVPKTEINKFQSLKQYSRGIEKLISDREKEKIKKEAEEKISAKDKDLQYIESILNNPEVLINRLDLEKVGNSLYCTKDVLKGNPFNKRGQGLYIWTDLILLKDWDGKSQDLKTKFKFGQYGSYTKSNKNLQQSLDAGGNIEIKGSDLGLGKIANETIQSYTGVSISPKVILYVRDLTDLVDKKIIESAYDVEQEVKNILLKSDDMNWARDEYARSKEVYVGGTFGELLGTIKQVLGGKRDKKDYPMRREQQEAHDAIIRSLDNNGNKEFLLAAKMRFGKNFTILNAIKTLNERHPNSIYKNNLVITYKPAVFSSLEDDIKSHQNFDGWEIIDLRNTNKNFNNNDDKIRIFVASAQWSLHKGKSDDEDDLDFDEETRAKMEIESMKSLSKNMGKLASINFGVIVADEYHYGTKSYRFNDLLKKLTFEKIIYVSGTAMKDIATSRFSDDQIYSWGYLEEQKKREEEIKQREEDRKKGIENGYYPHIQMPKMHFYKMELSEEAKRLANESDVYTPEQGFSFRKLIDTKENGKLKNEQLMRVLLEQIMGKYGHLNSVMLNQDVEGGLDHTFWIFDKHVKGIKAVAELMKSMPLFNDYEIIAATGELNSSIDDVKEKIKRAIGRKEKTITLSCYRFKEGTTVPWWNGVVMLDDGESVEEYLQAIFRCQSPNPKDNKENCYVFDFNPERLLSIYHDIAQWATKNTDKVPHSEIIKNFITYAPLLQSDGNEMVEVSADEVIEHFRLHGSFSEKMANERVFNKEEIFKVTDTDIVEALKSVSSKREATKIILNTNELENQSKVKNAIIKRIANDNPDMDNEEIEELADIEIIKEKIRNVLRTIPSFLMVTEEDEKTLDEIIKTKDPSLFKEITGVEPSFLQILIDKNIIIPKVLNQTIEFISDSIKNLSINPTLEGAEDFIKRNLIMAGEDTSTPNSIVNEMLDKLPKEIWTNPNATFCDPVCGTGKFLMGIFERLMKGLKNVIPDEEERRIHIIENQIYGVDNVKYKTIIAQNLLRTKGLKHHIINGDSLKLNWDDMPKFDVVVGNPPYKKTLHLDFLKLAYEISNRWIVWVHPISWIYNRKGAVKKYSEMKELIGNQIVDLKIFNGNPVFNISLISPLSITFIDKNLNNGGKIQVYDDIEGRNITYENINDFNKWNNQDIYLNLENKILNLAKKKNLFDYRNKGNGPIFVNFARIRGHKEEKDPHKMDKDDFYTLFPKNYIPERKITQDAYFSFKDINRAKNFLDFLKTRWAMFALSIYKNGAQSSGGELKAIPWLDWSDPWTEDRFEKLINATPEEKEFVYKNIPDYYGIAK